MTDQRLANIPINEDALHDATDAFIGAWALFRSPEFGGMELVRSEYEAVVRSAVVHYLAREQYGRSTDV